MAKHSLKAIPKQAPTISVYRAAQELSVSRQHLNEVLRGNRVSASLRNRYEALLRKYETGIGSN
jgi:hypothetical protein